MVKPLTQILMSLFFFALLANVEQLMDNEKAREKKEHFAYMADLSS